MLAVSTLYEYVPFGSLNVILFVADENDYPFDKFTYHIVPDGNTLSGNIDGCGCFGENDISIYTFFPLTVNDPDDGNGPYL